VISGLLVSKPAATLSLANSEHLRTAYWAGSLGCWLAVLHRYAPGIFHFSLSPALDTICLHLVTSFVFCLG